MQQEISQNVVKGNTGMLKDINSNISDSLDWHCRLIDRLIKKDDRSTISDYLNITDPYEPPNTRPGIINQESPERQGDPAADSGQAPLRSSDHTRDKNG